MASTHFVYVDAPPVERARALIDAVIASDGDMRKEGGIATGEGRSKVPSEPAAEKRSTLASKFQDGDVSGFIGDVLTYGDALLFGSKAEMSSKISLLLTLLEALEEAGAYRKAVDSIANCITEASLTSSRARLGALASLYNGVSTVGSAKVSVLRTTVRFAAEAGLGSELSGFLSSPDAMTALLSRWNTSGRDTRSVLAAVARALASEDDGESAAQAFRLRYLAACEGAELESEEESECSDVAVAAALGYIRSPVVSQRSELPAMKAVRLLAESPETKHVHQLLSIFATGKVQEYRAFASDHAEWMQSVGINPETSLRTIRLLSFASLAAKSADDDSEKGGIVTYTDIAKAIDVDEKEVEEWIVEAIRLGLVDARMDQERSQVRIGAALHREFGSEQWMALNRRLAAWKANVDTFMSTLADTKPPTL